MKTKIGNFEWQVISGRLESSGYLPAGSDRQHAGTNIYVPKINQLRTKQMTGGILQGLRHHLFSKMGALDCPMGFIRWVQMYAALVEGKYFWMEGSPNLVSSFFSNLFRKNDVYENYEAQTDQSAGLSF